MSTMMTARSGLLPAVLATFGFVLAAGGSARAIEITFDPMGPLTIDPPGTMFTVDVNFSGLGDGMAPSVGAFDVDVTNSNPAVLQFDSAIFGNALGTPSGQAITSAGGTQSSIDLFEVSLLSEADLNAMQPASFTAGTLAFTAIQPGQSTLALVLNEIGDALGNPLGGITVGSPLGVTVTPLPAAIAVLVPALGGLGLIAWRRRRGAAAAPG
ncbi:MAG: hypothetical protein R3349_08380 [Geminicoccaceae bacterium]|nr:hypothetical protein [Geminicoccaceae bacterium]